MFLNEQETENDKMVNEFAVFKFSGLSRMVRDAIFG